MQVDGIKLDQSTALLCYTRTMTPTLLLWLLTLNVCLQPSGKSSPDTVTSPLYSGWLITKACSSVQFNWWLSAQGRKYKELFSIWPQMRCAVRLWTLNSKHCGFLQFLVSEWHVSSPSNWKCSSVRLHSVRKSLLSLPVVPRWAGVISDAEPVLCHTASADTWPTGDRDSRWLRHSLLLLSTFLYIGELTSDEEEVEDFVNDSARTFLNVVKEEVLKSLKQEAGWTKGNLLYCSYPTSTKKTLKIWETKNRRCASQSKTFSLFCSLCVFDSRH